MTCRPLSGSSSTRWFSMSWPTPVLRVSTIAALAVTVICSDSSPSDSTTLTAGVAFTVSTMPVCA